MPCHRPPRPVPYFRNQKVTAPLKLNFLLIIAGGSIVDFRNQKVTAPLKLPLSETEGRAQLRNFRNQKVTAPLKRFPPSWYFIPNMTFP